MPIDGSDINSDDIETVDIGLDTGDDLVFSRPQSATISAAGIVLTDASERFITQDSDDVVVSAAGGDDAVITGSGNDVVLGGAGSDLLIGGDGRDTIAGGIGNDILKGGGDDDIFVINESDFLGGIESDRIVDFTSGSDIIQLRGFADLSSFEDLNFLSINGNIAVDLGQTRFVVLEGISSADQLSSADFEFPETEGPISEPAATPNYLTTGNDRYIASGNGAEDIRGLDGDDALITAGGDDFAAGGDGSDLIKGGDGEDTIVGGAGSDVLGGGSGSDVFRFFAVDFESDATVVSDSISDFEVGVDTIELVGFDFSSFADIPSIVVGSGLALQVAPLRFIVLTGITDRQDLLSTDFSFVDAIGDRPITSLQLLDDTGPSDTDGKTSDPSLTGTATDADGNIERLEISVNDGAYLDISSFMDELGNFGLSGADLESLLGGPLSDGAISVQLRALDDIGNFSDASALNIDLDTSTPELSELGLAITSDTGVVGDLITSLRKARLTGEGEPGATVTDGQVSTVVANDGSFTLSGVDVALGDNTIQLTITDAAGNSSNSTLEVTGIEPTGNGGAPVLTWNDIALQAIADNASNPLEASRVLAMQSVAVYDVVAALDASPAFRIATDADAGASLDAAVATASYFVLNYAFPAFGAELDAYLAESLADVPDGANEDAGIALGLEIASRVVDIRDQDGWDDFETYPGSDDVGAWRETGPFYGVAIDPQYATLKTWTLDGPDQFRPDGPPDLTSEAYAAAVEAVKAIGAIDSDTRTDDQALAARFWKDGLGTETTPGHWNSIATDHLKDESLGAAEDARALAILNVSIADAMIAAWDSKYAFGFWRPEDAIRHADEDDNPGTIADPDWQPYLFAPAHPEYVSGHAAASGAAAAALTALFGDQSFTTSSLGVPGVDRSFDSYWEAAQENADSRLWAGVHYDFSNQDGLDLGEDVALWAIEAFNNAADNTPPTIIIDVSVGYTSDLPFAVNGAVLDGLTGVEALTVSVNGGTPSAVTFEDNGVFTYSLGASTSDGTYDLAFNATDGAGNASETVTSTITVDRLAPALTLTSLNATDELEGTDARLTGSIDGTGSPIVALGYQIDGGKLTSLTFNQQTGSFDAALNLAMIAAGDHTVTVTAVDAAGNASTQDIPLSLATEVPFAVSGVSPAEGASEVGSTFRPEVYFTRPVDPDTITSDTFFASDAAGNKLAARTVTSEDGLTAWLFFEDPLPGSNQITLTLDGSQIAATDGALLDGDGDGDPAGDFFSSFTTVSTTAVANTSISGYIVDPGNDLKPMTSDDYSSGPDGADYTDDDVFKSPIEGATVFILGLEHIKVVTDENGYFELTEVPAGNVKIAVDGRTATNAPEGIFWPEMVMDANIVAGQANTMMAAMNSGEERDAVTGRGEVYLPRVSTEILQDVSDTEETEIGMPVSAAEDLTEEQRSAIKLVVQPGTALDENGNPVEDAQVGISTVPPELVMDMLPAGLMQHTFDLTIQAPDSAVFTTPAELTVPNIFDAEPGTKLNVLSFDHTTGRLVIEGTATVSEDGLTVTTDPDTGITKPGWHGITPPGSETEGPEEEEEDPDQEPDPEPDPECEDDGFSQGEVLSLAREALNSLVDVLKEFGSLGKVAAVFDCVRTTINSSTSFIANSNALFESIFVTGRDVFKNALATANDVKSLIFTGLKKVSDLVSDQGTNKLAAGIKAAQGVLGLIDSAVEKGFDPDCPDPFWSSVQSTAQKIKVYIDTAVSILNYIDNFIRSGVVGTLEGIETAICTAIDYIQSLIALKESLFPLGAEQPFADASDPQPGSFAEELTAEELAQVEAALNDMVAGGQDVMTVIEPPVDVDIDGLEDLRLSGVEILDDLSPLYLDLEGLPTDAPFIIELEGTIPIRGVTGANGSVSVFLPPTAEVTLRIFDPETGFVGTSTFTTAESGETTRIPTPVFGPPEDPTDSDDDQLVDIVEHIIGTSAENPDTDGDMLTDGFEVSEGLNPLGDFANTTGIINTLEIGSGINDILVADRLGNRIEPTALVFTKSGIAVVDISQARAPELVSVTPTIEVVDAALDVNRALVSVVYSTGETRLYDFQDPTTPEYLYSLSTNGRNVAMFEGTVAVGGGQLLQLYSVDDGTLVDQISYPGGSFAREMDSDGLSLYVLDTFSALHVIDVVNNKFILRGSVQTNVNLQERDIYAADGVVYIPANNGFDGGFITVDVSDPTNPTIISGPDNLTLAGDEIALNGSGSALLIGNPGASFGVNAIDLVDVRDPENTANLVTRFELDAKPTAVTISGGLGYVGDSSGLLHTVNYAPLDVNGIAPSVEFSELPLDVDPNADGIQVLEGSSLSLRAVVDDDVQVRDVRLFRDGLEVSGDLEYPFEFFFDVPDLEDLFDGNITLQLEAMDTGGNIGLSDELVIQVVSDTVAPTVVSANPTDTGILLVAAGVARFLFDEEFDPNTITADALTVTYDETGETVTAESVSFFRDNREAIFVLADLQEGEGQLTFDLSSVADTLGNTNPGASYSKTVQVFDLPAGTNVVLGTDGNDRDNLALSGSIGTDAIFGFEGDDWAFASFGEDIIDLGSGFDDYILGSLNTPNGMVYNLTDAEIDGVPGHTIDFLGGVHQTILNVESLNMSGSNETIYFGAVDSTTQSFDRGGDDIVFAPVGGTHAHIFHGGSGTDQYVGTDQNDTLRFDDPWDQLGAAWQGIYVAMSAPGEGIVNDGWGFEDTFTSIEIFSGTEHRDEFFGSSADDEFRGIGGEDVFYGSAGDDRFFGGDDYDQGDQVSYSQSATGDLFTMGLVINNTEFDQPDALAFSVDKRGLGTDALSGINNIRGSDWGDVIYASSTFDLDGEIFISDQAGDDIVYVEDSQGGEGVDIIVGSGNDQYYGVSNSGDRLDFADWTEDRLGAQTQGVVLVFATQDSGSFTDPWGFTDIFEGFWRTTGSRFGDEITGTDGRQRLEGRDGDDTILGLAGDDELKGGLGNDTLDGGEGWDRIDYYDEWEDGGTNGIVVDFDTGIVVDPFMNTDQISGIEEIEGTGDTDEIDASSQTQDIKLDGNGGNDTLLSGSGNDNLFLWYGDGVANAGMGDDQVGLSVGSQTAIGGEGEDRVTYELRDVDPYAEVVIDLSTDVGGFVALGTDVDFDNLSGLFDEDLISGFERARVRGDWDANIRGTEARDRIETEKGADVVYGGGGSDSIQTGANNDVVFAGADHDFIQVGSGSDYVDGGEDFATLSYDYDHYNGDDENDSEGSITVTFTSEHAGTIVDWDGDIDTFVNIDAIYGTPWDDVMTGAEGSQRFFAFAGNDTIDGGAGDSDEVDWRQTQYHEDEDDAFSDYEGINVDLEVDTNSDGDIVGEMDDGYGFTDVLISIEDVQGTNLDDTITGSSVDNRIRAREGNDIISGEGGNDEIFGGTGADTLSGGSGDDFLRGGQGDDDIDGGSDWDVVGYRYNRANYIITDNGNGDVTVTDTTGRDGTDNLTGIEAVEFSDAYFELDTLVLGATEDADDLGDSASTETQVIYGFGGDDTINGGLGDDDLRGGNDNDLITGGGGRDDAYGGDGNDTIDVFDSVADFDYVEPGPGNDVIVGDGADGIYYNNFGRNDISGLNYGLVIDADLRTVESVTPGLKSDSFNSVTSVETGQSFSGIRSFEGTQYDDTILGSDTTGKTSDVGFDFESYQGEAGNDVIDGRGGYDQVSYLYEYGGGAIVANLESGEIVDTHGDTDLVSNIESVEATLLADILTGSDGFQSFRPFAGNDDVDGGAGELDRVDYSRDVDQGGSDGIVADLNSGEITDPFGDVDSVSNIEWVRGTAVADTIVGATSVNSWLDGRGGNDTLTGGSLADIVSGGDGADLITAGGGGDLVAGGAGEDVFEFAPNQGATTIGGILVDFDSPFAGSSANAADFVSSTDLISLTGFALADADAAYGAVADNLDGHATFAAEGTQIVFWGVSKLNLTALDFELL